MTFIVAVALMLFSSEALIVKGTDDALGTELHESYKAWFAALYRGDAATMDSVEVDDFVLISVNGFIEEKHRPRVSDPMPVPEDAPERAWTDGVVRRYGDTAILTGRVINKTPKWTASWSTTAVFVRRADKWLMASVQWTPVRNEKQ